jgi:hypothetical protein
VRSAARERKKEKRTHIFVFRPLLGKEKKVLSKSKPPNPEKKKKKKKKKKKE